MSAKSLLLTAEVSRVDEVTDFINAELEAHDVPMKAILQIDIAVEELFVNIARYAYHPDVGEAAVSVAVLQDPPCVEIRLTDRGKPYDPLSREDPDVTLGVEDREIGGLGVYMVKKSMDEASYAYRDGQNILTIRKLL